MYLFMECYDLDSGAIQNSGFLGNTKNEIWPRLVSTECPYWKKNCLCSMRECSSDICRVTKKMWQVPSHCAVTQSCCRLDVMPAMVAQRVNIGNKPLGQTTELLNSLTFSPIFFISY